MFKYVIATLVSSIAVATTTTPTKVDLNPTQKQFTKNVAIAAELSNGKLSDKFKFQVYHNLKSDADQQAWTRIAGDWAKNKYKVTAYFDQFYVYRNGRLMSSVRVQQQEGRIQAVINDYRKLDIDPKNIYQSLQNAKSAALTPKRLPALFLGEEAFADELPLGADTIYAVIASSLGVSGELHQVNVPALMQRDSDIKIKMGNDEVPTSDWLAKIKNLDGKATKINCSSSFSGSVDGHNYTTSISDEKVTISFNNAKYEFDPRAPMLPPVSPTGIHSLRELAQRYASNFQDWRSYQQCQDDESHRRWNSSLSSGAVVDEGPMINDMIKCVNQNSEYSTQAKLSCISGDCMPGGLNAKEDFDREIQNAKFDFMNKNHLDPQIVCVPVDSVDIYSDVQCRLTGTPPTGLAPAVLAAYEDQMTKLENKKSKRIKRSNKEATAGTHDARSFDEQVLLTTQYIKSLQRCCASDTCRTDMFRDTKIQLMQTTAPGSR